MRPVAFHFTTPLMHLVCDSTLCCALATSCCLVSRPCQNYPTHLIDSAVQERTSLRDIFFLKSPFFWMLRLLAAKFSRSVRVPADNVEWMLAETDKVEPGKQRLFKTNRGTMSRLFEYRAIMNMCFYLISGSNHILYLRGRFMRELCGRRLEIIGPALLSPFLVTSSSITSNKRRSVSVKDTPEEKHTKCGECQ